jgi:uncharacterized SAM-binding protein YcdF (DUF218 family)
VATPRDHSAPGNRLTGLVVGALAVCFYRDLGLGSLASLWGDSAIVLCAGAVLGALVWPTRLRALLAAITAGLGLLWLLAAFTPLAARLGDGLVRRDALRSADAALVLGSRLQIDGDPTPAAASRLLRGFEMLAEGHASVLILTEQPAPMGPYLPLARQFAQHFLPAAEILTVGPVLNTHEEAAAVGRLCRERGFKRLLVVTSPTHTRRACATVEREGIEVVCVPAVETRFDLETLDRPGDRLELFAQALHEHLGYWVYRRRGWLP